MITSSSSSSTPSQPPLLLPLVAYGVGDTPLPPQIAELDIAALSALDAPAFVGALEDLSNGAVRIDVAHCATKLLQQYDARLLFLLELTALCIVLMPYDDTPLHKGAVERAIRAYARLVGGLYSAQLTTEEKVLDAMARYHLPLEAVCIRRSPLPEALTLPRYRRPSEQTDAGRGAPLCIAFAVPTGYAPPSCHALLNELALAVEPTAEVWRRDHTCALIPAAADTFLFVVWTLLYDSAEALHNSAAAIALRDVWLARLSTYSIRGVPLSAAHTALLLRDTNNGCVHECVAGGSVPHADSPQNKLLEQLLRAVHCHGGQQQHDAAKAPAEPSYALLYAVDTDATMAEDASAISDLTGRKWRAFGYTRIGAWARHIAYQRMLYWRTRVAQRCRGSAAAFAEQMGMEQSFALAKRLLYSQLFTAMQQSASYEFTRMRSTGAADARMLWQRRDYQEVEERVRADPRLCEQFFRDLMGGARIQHSGDMWLQADNHLSFCVAGEKALGWVERGVRHYNGTAKPSGRGLGSLVVHCRGQQHDAAEAFSYVMGWWKAHTSGGSVLPVSPSRTVQRVAARTTEEDQQRIARVLSKCTAVLPGTVAHRYLRQTRGLADASVALIEQNPALRATSALYFAADDSYALNESNSARWLTTPGLVVLAEDSELLQRIYLDSETANKSTAARPPKRTMGRMVRDAPAGPAYQGGMVVAPGICVQQPPQYTKTGAATPPAPLRLCFVAEGPETALSVACAWPDSAVYATLGASTLGDFLVRDPLCVLVVCRENDKPDTRDALERSIHAALGRLRTRAAEVVCVWPPSDVKDFNDVHQRSPGATGTAEIRDCIQRQLLLRSVIWRQQQQCVLAKK